MSANQIGAAAAVLALIAVLLAVFVLGWWAPNVRVWQACGADQSFAVLRGLFEKPDLMTCYAIGR